MKVVDTMPISLRCALIAGGLSLVGVSASATTTYTVKAITAAGATYIYPTAINDAGTAVGYTGTSSGATHGFIYAAGKFTPLNYPNAADTVALGINKSGTIIGEYANSGFTYHGFIYSGGKFTSVDMPGASSTAFDAINDAGVIAGSAENSKGVLETFTYSDKVFTVVPTAKGDSPFPVAINASGEIAGVYNFTTDSVSSFLFANGKATTLPNPASVYYTRAFGMNKLGVVVGQAADYNREQYGFVYSKGHLGLVAFPGSKDSFLMGINDQNVMVGVSFPNPNDLTVSSAFVFDGKTVITLPAVSGSKNNSANVINNSGVVMGEAGAFAFIATPKP